MHEAATLFAFVPHSGGINLFGGWYGSSGMKGRIVYVFNQ